MNKLLRNLTPLRQHVLLLYKHKNGTVFKEPNKDYNMQKNDTDYNKHKNDTVYNKDRQVKTTYMPPCSSTPASKKCCGLSRPWNQQICCQDGPSLD